MSQRSQAAPDAEPWHDPQATPYLRVENLGKRFDEVTAVDAVSLDVYRTEVFCLLGGSGCGKSTLLRMLAGFEAPSSGKIAIDGVDMAGVPPYERPVNMMFQSYALFPHMSVAGNVAFGLKQDGLSRAEIAKRVGDMLELVRLDSMGKRRPHQLSGGQRQRVALARALVKRPKLLLLDEPLGALDKKLRERTQFELINIQEELGVTFIVVTHDQEEAMTLSTRVGVMHEGKIVQIGTPGEIYEHPGSRFVADFIGSVNLFEGRVTGEEAEHLLIESIEAGCSIRAERAPGIRPGARVWVALRPEKIVMSREPPAGDVNHIVAVVDEIAYLGGLSAYQLRAPSGKTVRVTQPNQMRATTDRITWEEQVHLSWHASSAVVLSS